MTAPRGAQGSEPAAEQSVISAAEEAVYKALLKQTNGSIGALVEACPHSVGEIYNALGALERAGLVTRATGEEEEFLPVRPDWALDELVAAHQRDLEQTRSRLAKVAALHQSVRANQQVGEIGEVIIGSSLVGSRFRQLQAKARREVRGLVTPPFVTQSQHYANLRDTQSEQLSEGVRYRIVYDQDGFEAQGGFESIMADAAAGEEARVADRLPLKLFMVDGSTALLPITGRDEPASLVVYEPGLLIALDALFEGVWARATPLAFDGSTPAGCLDDVSIRLLTLLRAGFPESTIARDLGLSRRTVQRRMHSLMCQAGVETKFQLGVRSVELGWMDPGPNKIVNGGSR